MADSVVTDLVPLSCILEHGSKKLYRVCHYSFQRNVSFQQAEGEKLGSQAGGTGEGLVFVPAQPRSVDCALLLDLLPE